MTKLELYLQDKDFGLGLIYNEVMKGSESEIKFKEIAEKMNYTLRITLILNFMNLETITKMNTESVLAYYESTRDLFGSVLHDSFFEMAKRIKMIQLDDSRDFDEMSVFRYFLIRNIDRHIRELKNLPISEEDFDVPEISRVHSPEEAYLMLREGLTLHPMNNRAQNVTLTGDFHEKVCYDGNFNEVGRLSIEFISSISDQWVIEEENVFDYNLN